MDKAFTSYHIQERSYVAYVKREIHRELLLTKFSETRIGEINIIVSELASNLVKHTDGGEFLYRICDFEDESVFEIICIDNGEGMADPARMMKDGVSSAGTLGQGLGALSRLSDHFHLYSLPKWGTVVYCMASSNKEKLLHRTGLDLDVKGLAVNKTGEETCGDGYLVKRTGSTVSVFLGDGLGHGPHAHNAVKKATEAFLECADEDPVSILRYVHEKVRRTRGLVAAVAVLDMTVKKWKICAIGNIMTRIYNGITFRNYMSYNGTIGLNIPGSLHESVFPAEKNQFIIMCSDGIRSRYDVTRYPSVSKYDMMVLAGAIFKDYNRATDDSSIVIARVV